MSTTNPAETYESYMVPTLFGPWADVLLRSAQPRPGDRVLNVACGTGVVARRVAPIVGADGRVAGLDLNPDMLAVARAVAEREGVPIEWHQGRGEQLPFPDAAFDLALCQFALMFFADRRAALGEMHRVVRPGGRIAVSIWQSLDLHPFYLALDEAIHRHLGMSAVRDIFALGDADALHALLTDAGFRAITIEPVAMTARFPHPEAFLAGEIDVDTASIPAMQHLDAQARHEVIAAIREDMEEPLLVATLGEHVVLPFQAHIAGADR